MHVCALKEACKKIQFQRGNRQLCALCLSESITNMSYVCLCVCVQRGGERVRASGRKCRAQRVWVGTLFSTERSPLCSTACRPHHRSYQATLYGLNGLAGMAAPRPPLHSPLLSARHCLSFTASSSVSFWPSSSPPQAFILFPFPSELPSSMSTCHSLQCHHLHLSHAAVNLACLPFNSLSGRLFSLLRYLAAFI